MATSTTTQAGPISASSTFGGVAFVSGNNVVAAHALTIDVASIIGSSPIGAPLAGPTSVVKASGGSLAASTSYDVRYAHVDAGGNESDLSAIVTTATDTTNKTLNVTLPTLPSGVSSFNVYFRNPANQLYFIQAAAVGAGVTAITALSTTTGYTPTPSLKVTNANGRLIINADLTVKGSIGLEGTTVVTDVIVTQAAGTNVLLDNSASPNTTFGYQIFCGNYNNSRRSIYWKANGTVNSRCSLKHSSGAHSQLLGPTSEVGHVDFSFTDITRFGSSVDNAFLVQSTATAGVVNFTNCVLDTCGRIQVVNTLATAYTLTFVNNTWKNSTGTENFRMVSEASSPTGARTWKGNVTDQSVILSLVGFVPGGSNAADVNIFLQSFGAPSMSVRTASAMQNCFFRLTGVSGMNRLGDWLECVCIADGNTMNGTGGFSAKADLSNPHWTTLSSEGVTGVYAITSCIFESFGSDDAGDVDYGTIASTYTAMSYCIAVPEDRDGGSFHGTGTMCTLNGAASCLYTFNHNTWYVGGQGAIALAEAGNGFAGMCDELQSNIVWNDAGHAALYNSTTFGRLTYEPTRINAVSGTSMVANTVNASKCGHNCRFNLYTGSGTDAGLGAYTDGGILGHSYHHYSNTGTFGATDVTADPQFKDSTVRFWTWVKSLAGATLPGNSTPDRKDYMAWGMYKLCLKNEPANADFDAAYTLGAYKAFIRAGFTPQNSSLKNAAHDGTDIGAVTAVIPVVGSGKGYLTRWRRHDRSHL